LIGGAIYGLVTNADSYKSVMQNFITDVQKNNKSGADALQSPQMNATDKKYYGNTSFDQYCYKLGDFRTPLFKLSFLDKATKTYKLSSIPKNSTAKYEELDYTLKQKSKTCNGTNTLDVYATHFSGSWLIAGVSPGINFNCNFGSGSASPSESNSPTTVSLGGKVTKVPLGTAASDSSFTIKVLSVVSSPMVTGDQPDSGTQYLEVDFSITSIANQKDYALNLNYNPTIIPKAYQSDALQLSSVDSGLGYDNPLTGLMVNSPKNVQITGKQSIEGNNVIPFDGTAQTVQAYGLYEISPGDKGTVGWDGVNNKTYNFELN
jgi:hypothetical protein